MFVELWERTKGKTRVTGVIRVTDGELQIEEKEPLSPPIKGTIEAVRKRFPQDDEFLRALPMEFKGSYVWAKLIQD